MIRDRGEIPNLKDSSPFNFTLESPEFWGKTQRERVFRVLAFQRGFSEDFVSSVIMERNSSKDGLLINEYEKKKDEKKLEKQRAHDSKMAIKLQDEQIANIDKWWIASDGHRNDPYIFKTMDDFNGKAGWVKWSGRGVSSYENLSKYKSVAKLKPKKGGNFQPEQAEIKELNTLVRVHIIQEYDEGYVLIYRRDIDGTEVLKNKAVKRIAKDTHLPCKPTFVKNPLPIDSPQRYPLAEALIDGNTFAEISFRKDDLQVQKTERLQDASHDLINLTSKPLQRPLISITESPGSKDTRNSHNNLNWHETVSLDESETFCSATFDRQRSGEFSDREALTQCFSPLKLLDEKSTLILDDETMSGTSHDAFQDEHWIEDKSSCLSPSQETLDKTPEKTPRLRNSSVLNYYQECGHESHNTLSDSCEGNLPHVGEIFQTVPLEEHRFIGKDSTVRRNAQSEKKKKGSRYLKVNEHLENNQEISKKVTKFIKVNQIEKAKAPTNSVIIAEILYQIPLNLTGKPSPTLKKTGICRKFQLFELERDENDIPLVFECLEPMFVLFEGHDCT